MARASATPPLLKVATEPHYAELSEVESFAEELPERFLYCREMGHNWRPQSAGRYRDGGFTRILRCTRCKTERHQEISNSGIVDKNKYVHPAGYLHEGMGRIVGEGRGILRLESIKRITQKAS